MVKLDILLIGTQSQFIFSALDALRDSEVHANHRLQLWFAKLCGNFVPHFQILACTQSQQSN